MVERNNYNNSTSSSNNDNIMDVKLYARNVHKYKKRKKKNLI